MKTSDEIIRVLRADEETLKQSILLEASDSQLPDLRRTYKVIRAIREFAEAPTGSTICYDLSS